MGSMTPHQWYEAEEALSYWVRQRTVEGVNHAWKILDRVVQEERNASDRKDSRLTTQWLNIVVECMASKCIGSSTAYVDTE